MIEEIAELRFAQEDGGLPTIFAAGSAPGESGVTVVTARFRGGMHISANPRRHHICFQLSEQSRFACRIGDQALSHEPRSGSHGLLTPAATRKIAEYHLDRYFEMVEAQLTPAG